jgi:hypothetical protein
MLEDLSPEEVHQAIDRLVDELLEASGTTAPPVDAVRLARDHLQLDLTPSRRRSRPAPEDELETPEAIRQWLAAQRVGEHQRPVLLQRLGVGTAEARGLGGPSLVNLFATHLLLPMCWFADDVREHNGDIVELHSRYSTVGLERIAWRLLDLTTPCIITVVDNDHVVRRRSNAWRVRRELAPAEQECQRYVHHYSRPRTICSKGWTVRGWPVHRADWKREVLRSVTDGEEGAEGTDLNRAQED